MVVLEARRALRMPIAATMQSIFPLFLPKYSLQCSFISHEKMHPKRYRDPCIKNVVGISYIQICTTYSILYEKYKMGISLGREIFHGLNNFQKSFTVQNILKKKQLF